MKILVAHPGRQHVFQLLTALSKIPGAEVHFTTYIAFRRTPRFAQFLPSGVRSLLLKETNKLTYNLPNVKLHRQFLKGIFLEILERLFRKSNDQIQLYKEVQFDCQVAKNLHKIQPDVIIGYEIASQKSFLVAKELGIYSVLDLAQIHCLTLDNIARKHEALKAVYSNKKYAIIEQRKLAEYELASSIWAISTQMQDSLNEHRLSNKTKLIYLGVDANRFKPKKGKSKSNAGSIKLIYVGNISNHKGMNLLLDVVTKLNENVTKATLTLIGNIVDPPLRDRIEQLSSCVNYKGFVNHSELVDELVEHDLFIFPSFLDSWGMVVLEAMATGLPAIVSTNTGAKDAVQKGGGVVVNDYQVATWVNTIEQYLLKPEKIIEEGREALQIAQRYSSSNYETQIFDAMKSIQITITNKRNY